MDGDFYSIKLNGLKFLKLCIRKYKRFCSSASRLGLTCLFFSFLALAGMQDLILFFASISQLAS